jgi:peroxiredoxin
MMFKTLELGPSLNTLAPDFVLSDHSQHKRSLVELMGNRGLLLGFIGDIWEPASVRRILWLQRNSAYFTREHVNLALVVVDQPHTLYGFYMSSSLPLHFPMLADTQRKVHELFNMTRYSGLALIDSHCLIRDKWLVPDERVWPKIHEIVDSIHAMTL